MVVGGVRDRVDLELDDVALDDLKLHVGSLFRREENGGLARGDDYSDLFVATIVLAHYAVTFQCRLTAQAVVQDSWD